MEHQVRVELTCMQGCSLLPSLLDTGAYVLVRRDGVEPPMSQSSAGLQSATFPFGQRRINHPSNTNSPNCNQNPAFSAG